MHQPFDGRGFPEIQHPAPPRQQSFNLELDLTGNYQVHNILTAIAVIDLLHQETPLTISLRALTEGMRTVASGTALQGRWQKLGDKPLTICDTGHNAHGIRYVAEQLAATPHRDLYCVLGFVNDKDLSSVLPLFPKEARYIFTQPGNERALPAGKLAEKAAAYGLRGEVADTVRRGIGPGTGNGPRRRT